MKRLQKILIMIVVLMAPVCVFLFLKGFGSNKFVLPVFYTEGNPLKLCNNNKGSQFKLTRGFFSDNNLTAPILIYVASYEENLFHSDLANVLNKYPGVHRQAVKLKKNLPTPDDKTSVTLDSLAFYNFINCQLILGEDHQLSEPITNKYVLVDNDFIVRGYYQLDELDEIERLDVELDILLNN